MLGITSMMSMSLKSQLQSGVSFRGDVVRRNFVTYIQHGYAWVYTINDPSNTSMACLVTGANCPLGANAFQLRDPANQVVFNSLNPAEGFTRDGQLCNSFDPVNGNNFCPIRVDLTWAPICAPGVLCVNPLVKVEGKMSYKPATADQTVAFNPANYSFEVVRRGNETIGQCDWGPYVWKCECTADTGGTEARFTACMKCEGGSITDFKIGDLQVTSGSTSCNALWPIPGATVVPGTIPSGSSRIYYIATPPF